MTWNSREGCFSIKRHGLAWVSVPRPHLRKFDLTKSYESPMQSHWTENGWRFFFFFFCGAFCSHCLKLGGRIDLCCQRSQEGVVLLQLELCITKPFGSKTAAVWELLTLFLSAQKRLRGAKTPEVLFTFLVFVSSCFVSFHTLQALAQVVLSRMSGG